MRQNISVQRRFPTYDFVLGVPLSVSQAAAKLDHFLSHQQRPKGFVLTDPRVDGVVSGATFSLRRRESGLGGSIAPYAEGYFVPSDSGANAAVRVQIPAWWWLFDVVVLFAVLTTFDFAITVKSLAAVTLMIFFAVATSVLPLWVEASRVTKLLQKVLAP